MTIQLTFVRGNYSGVWREDHPDSRSGSLEILFKGKQEIILHDKAEHAASIVFFNYVTPDHHQLAEQILDNYLLKNHPFSDGLKTVGEDDRHIQHDVYAVRKIVKSLLIGQGYDPSEFSEFDQQ